MQDLDAQVKTYEGSNLYDFDNHIQMNWYPKRVIHHSKNSKSMLELGLGHGISTNIFSANFERYNVIDASQAVIDNFHQKFPDTRVKIVKDYFENYDTTEKFDVIMLGFVLEHVDDPVRIIEKYKSFLTPEGKMFITVPNSNVLNRRLGYVAGLLPDLKEMSDHDHMAGHKRYYCVESLTADINRAKCSVVRFEGIYLKPFTTRQMISLRFDESIIDALCTVGIDYPELCCGLLTEIKPN